MNVVSAAGFRRFTQVPKESTGDIDHGYAGISNGARYAVRQVR